MSEGKHRHPDDRRPDAEVGEGLPTVQEPFDAQRSGRDVEMAAEHRPSLEFVEVIRRNAAERVDLPCPQVPQDPQIDGCHDRSTDDGCDCEAPLRLLLDREFSRRDVATVLGNDVGFDRSRGLKGINHVVGGPFRRIRSVTLSTFCAKSSDRPRWRFVQS